MRVGWLRRLVAKGDARRAAEREERALNGAFAGDAVDPRFRAEMSEGRSSANAVLLGTHADDPSVEVSFDVDDLIGSGHALILGGTGAGKTRAVSVPITALLARFSRDPSAPRPWLLDYKGDLWEIVRNAAEGIAAALPREERERFLDAFVVVNPFSTEALVPLQILARPPDVAIDDETIAYEVSTLFERVVGAELGVKQDALNYHLILLGVSRGMRFTELPALLNDPRALEAAAAGSASAQVRSFFGTGFRLQGGSLSGLQARFARLLRTPSLRLMLSAPSCFDFRGALRDKIVCANFGNPPLGCEEHARFFGGIFTAKLTRAIFDRPPDEASRKVLITTDEWQEGLAGGREIAQAYERVLAMSRAKGCAFVLVSQSLAGAAAISSSLPKTVATNTSVQALFRASIEDARAMTHLLPVTGRRVRAASSFPWEGRREHPFLSRAEELAALVDEVASLPNRTFYFWQRGAPYRAQLVRSADVEVETPDFLPEDVARRVRVGSAAVSVAELEAHRAEIEATALEGDAARTLPLGPPRRRGGR